MPARAYRGVPLCQYHLYAFWSGVYMGVVSGGSSCCRPCSWKVRMLGTHSAPCAIGSSWRAAVASLQFVMAGWLRSRRLTAASVEAGWRCGGLRPRPLPPQGGGLGLGEFRIETMRRSKCQTMNECTCQRAVGASLLRPTECPLCAAGSAICPPNVMARIGVSACCSSCCSCCCIRANNCCKPLI